MDESAPAHGDAPASSSRESGSVPRGKVVSGKHSIKNSLFEGPKLRHLHKDQDDKGSLQKTHWRSSTSSKKIWRLDYSKSRGARLGNSMTGAKPKKNQDTEKSFNKSLEPKRKPKVIYIEDSLEFGKACEDLSWNHCTSTPHRSESNGIAERTVRRVKEGTSAVLLQSGLNENWWADSMECYTYLRSVTDLFF